ncbi:MAG: tyrosine-type recombinase/integrase [Microcoleus sp.]
MNAQRKTQSDCDVKIYSDKGSLALRFPVRHNPLWEQLDGKSLKGKPKCLGIGKYGFSADVPDDWKRANQIAIAMESDLDHPEWDKLFDCTLAKYGLGGGKYAKLAAVLQMPGTVATEPEMTVGQMWGDYLVWKEGQVEPTTFKTLYSVRLTNALKGLKWNHKTKVYFNNGLGIWNFPLSIELKEKALLFPMDGQGKTKLLQALSEAFLRAQSQGKVKLAVNPFHELWKQAKPDTRDKYKPVTNGGETLKWWQAQDAKREDESESDRRAFSKEERDIIIKAFYESPKDNERHAAPLIEFLFLTGCRPGEAFALTWGDIKFGSEILWFSKSYNGLLKNTQVTKTKTIRMFQLYSCLTELLMRIKPDNAIDTDLVFEYKKGASFNSNLHSNYWLGFTKSNTGTDYHYPGVVTRLVEEGKINGYLPPYHTRHTYITLTAQANGDNPSALLLLAHSCGNSVEIIIAYYLEVDKSVKLTQV